MNDKNERNRSQNITKEFQRMGIKNILVLFFYKTDYDAFRNKKTRKCHIIVTFPGF